MKFSELVEEQFEILVEDFEDELHDFIEENYDMDEVELLAEDFEISVDEATELMENIKKRVNAKGQVRKIRSREYRSRHAAMTTGMSKAKLKLRARRSAKARRKNPTGLRKALRKRAKAMKRRRMMGIK